MNEDLPLPLEWLTIWLLTFKGISVVACPDRVPNDQYRIGAIESYDQKWNIIYH